MLEADLTAVPFAAEPLVRSRPTGTAVLHVEPDGHLLKRRDRGAEPRDISFMAAFEDANDLLDLAFTADSALLYVAAHPTHVDLHRLRIGEQSFETLATVGAGRAAATAGAATGHPAPGACLLAPIRRPVGRHSQHPESYETETSLSRPRR